MQSQFVLTVLVLLGSFVSGQKNAEVKIVLTYFNSAEDRAKEIFNMDYRLENTWTERPSSYVVDLTDQDLSSEQALTEWADTNVYAFYFIFHMIEKWNLEEDMRPFITVFMITGVVSMVLAIINFEVAKSRSEKDTMRQSSKEDAAANASDRVTNSLNIIIFLLVVAATVCFMIVQSSDLILTFGQAFFLAFPVIALVVVVLTLRKQYQEPKKEVSRPIFG